jgi:enterochelin esterase-like enzyme
VPFCSSDFKAIRIGQEALNSGLWRVSMGGYGAMNIGLSHPDLFKTIAGLGVLSTWIISQNH